MKKTLITGAKLVKNGKITAKVAMDLTDTKRTSFYKLVGMTEENA